MIRGHEHSEEFAVQRGAEEFADARRTRTLPGLLSHRLALLRHSKCNCGEQACVLMGARMFCRTCAGVESILRRGQRMMRGR
jgi:hypothetical protein